MNVHRRGDKLFSFPNKPELFSLVALPTVALSLINTSSGTKEKTALYLTGQTAAEELASDKIY